ncbi:MAG TPA: hypothetical protein VL614_21130 [Acetobacteraceae bacterium]|jgi:hypothetical protein|nr:hypothetical protein [Acetobacteraceae bacterium]
MWGAQAATGIVRKWFRQERPRGAAVPFEAPALRMARVCDDERDGMIAILRDFANNGSTYIVPWNSLSLVVPLTDNDKALHTAVGNAKAATPAQVRAVVSDLALSGALGPEAAARESERLGTERTTLADVQLVLILHFLDSSGADLAPLMVDPDRWRQADAKSAIAAAAVAVGVRRQDLYRRIAEFARLLAPVGLVTTEGTIQSGWLRALHNEIDGFSQSIANEPQAITAETRDHLMAIRDAAAGTARLAGVVINMLDYAVLDIASTIGRWHAELPVLSRAIEQLSLMLDEWPSLMKSVHDALRSPPDDLPRQLRILCAVLPRVPGSEPRTTETQSGSSASDALAARLGTIWSMLRASRSTEE